MYWLAKKSLSGMLELGLRYFTLAINNGSKTKYGNTINTFRPPINPSAPQE